MEFTRYLNLKKLLEKKSFFLFGPRATGKTHLIEKQLGKDAIVFDLLRSDLFLKLSANPSELEAILAEFTPSKIVVLDEIQKIPALLDEVHRLIEKKRIKFLLTGSSARKLRHGGANLLAGRAWTAELFPLVTNEIKNFNLERYLRYGGLPAVYPSKSPEEELRAYVKTYLYEEIQAEGLVRKIPAFSRFLLGAALSNGQLLNFAQIGSDAGVPATTVTEYYRILEDTLIGFMVEPWLKSKKRKAISTAKFYFFDTGVTHALAGTKTIDRNSDLYGKSFEQFIGMELRAYLSYKRLDLPLCYWRSVNHQEVDYVVGDLLAVEVKAAKRVSRSDLKGLIALQEENKIESLFLVSNDPIAMKMDGIRCIPWQIFLKELWADRLI